MNFHGKWKQKGYLKSTSESRNFSDAKKERIFEEFYAHWI